MSLPNVSFDSKCSLSVAYNAKRRSSKPTGSFYNIDCVFCFLTTQLSFSVGRRPRSTEIHAAGRVFAAVRELVAAANSDHRPVFLLREPKQTRADRSVVRRRRHRVRAESGRHGDGTYTREIRQSRTVRFFFFFLSSFTRYE